MKLHFKPNLAIMSLSSYLREKEPGEVRLVREIAEKIEDYAKVGKNPA